MIDKKELEEMIQDYIKENLSIRASRKWDYGYGGQTSNFFEITLSLDGKEISSTIIYD